MRARLITLAVVVLAAGGIVIAAIAASRSGVGGEAPPASQTAELLRGIPQDGPWLGSPDAPVVVEEFADPQCPFCARAARRVLPEFIREYVRPGRVRLRLRTLTSIGPDSLRAGRMAVATGLQDHQWGFVERFYARQGAENSGYATDAFLRSVAAEVPGLDPARALRERDDPAVARRLAEDREAARRAGVTATPTFLAGRRGGPLRAVDEPTLDALRDAVDPLLR